MKIREQMPTSKKTQRLREKIQADIKYSKQATFDNLQETSKTAAVKGPTTEKQKWIEIIGIVASFGVDELVLKVAFRLVPSRTAFSRVISDLYFDEQKIESLPFRILTGPLSTDESEFTSTLDMTGIPAGQHRVRVEMYEPWASQEKLNETSKEISIEYVPQTRESRWVRIPTVKSVAGQDLTVVSGKERDVFREIDEAMREEENSKKDAW